MVDHNKNLEEYLKRVEEDYSNAIEEFRNSYPKGETFGKYREQLDFIMYRGKGPIFNFDYYFPVKFQSGLEYIADLMLDDDLRFYLNARSDIFLDAIRQVQRIFIKNVIFNSSYNWYKTDEFLFSSKEYYDDMINIMEKYRKEVIEREINALIMEEKLSIKKHNIKKRLDSLLLYDEKLKSEIGICNDIIFSIFNIE